MDFMIDMGVDNMEMVKTERRITVDILEKLTRTGQDLADKAKDVYDINMINLKISNEQKALNRRYIALAKKYLEKYENEIDSEFMDDVDMIHDHIENIQDYKLQKAVVRGVKMCAKCGKPLDYKAGYCSACGEKVNS